MQSWSLAAPETRARFSFMMIAGAVVVASAIAQAAANPIFIGGRDLAFSAAPAIEAPLPAVNAPPASAPPAYAFHAPVPGYPINSPFGLRRMPWEPRGRMHEGVDIAAPRGLPVGATLAGEVIRAGVSSTYGRYVEVRHADGLTSLYGHLGRIRRGLAAGTALAAGEAVGYVGNTGRSTGEHLHFEIRSDGKPLNPAHFMGKSFASAEDLPLTAAARFSRRVRLAVVSPQALARMAPQLTAAKDGKAAAASGDSAPMRTRDGRVRATLVMGDPSPQAMREAAEAAPAPTQADAPATPAPLTDYSAMRLDQAG